MPIVELVTVWFPQAVELLKVRETLHSDGVARIIKGLFSGK